ncbi:UDP-N-acetylglucosamine acyltransferase [Legionella geestiana]|uniref:Acyl-[acyl-carrier-protein]--UDP-N-acetylglucosamine O-acyltransferase n=1 Tax=Legionella geestiana TaxID=45065 RepID=A0A0W0TGP7_9GAMM|nr:acyl-ACP--UDP-N-acetylglucosamine O-acyltransferase [Legionella geestiana]KTC94739.1 UDP-N-acetylglucosamine acyltransferase [Legionella geestiana]QBS12706.1 acyl-ACP--UDP-N-acetylglucosamine O-acyltransferase [Legionella geestiana]QDQ39577.1 acyl-ACP--UDP-N-acetylglucosamine O-acyltransferase [Legionella geestiana]STX54828.1 acyl-(acyl carrier protein)-UDP-N-acetylglucosamine acyltransferase [Legionella geestiana]
MISEHAIIHPSARLGKGVSVGPGAIIGADVEIGDNTWVGPHAVIEGPTRIGKNNRIFQFASVGDEPQDTTYQGEKTSLEIGDGNVIREYCMISRGTVKGGGITRIGNNNFLMAFSHIGHDCMIGNHVIMINYAALSGHVLVNDYAIIGGYAAVHQFCSVGQYAFIARATYVTKDVLPYVMIAGHTTSACGINTVGLKRRGFTPAAIDGLRRAYKIIFRKGYTVQQAVAELEQMQAECPEVTPLIDSLNTSTRGIVR